VRARLLYTDSDLITLLSDGSEEAFDEIYQRHWRKLFNSAYKRLRDEDQCEDLLQNVFADLWERRKEVKISNIEAYLTTAVRFQVIKISSRSRSNGHFVDLVETTLTSPLLADTPLNDQELSELLRLWMAALPEKRRKIFAMHFIDGLESSHIAALLDLSQKTVQNQLAVASGALRNEILRISLLPTMIHMLSIL
jgi:RNA polymerase sigma factor (sigma-70 family)